MMAMVTRVLKSAALVVSLTLVLSGCHHHDRDQPDDRSAAREAGREAYKLSQETKRLARQAGHQLRQASKEARQGWNEEKHEQRAKDHQ